MRCFRLHRVVTRASTLTIGIFEGIAESTAMIVKVFSGVISDPFPKRKPLVVLGYGIAARLSSSFRSPRRFRGSCRALRRSDRQGHSRRAARCADRGSFATGGSGRKLRACDRRSTPSAGWRAVARDRRDGVVRRRLPDRVLGGRRPCVRRVAPLVFGVIGPAATGRGGRAARNDCSFSDIQSFCSRLRDRCRNRGACSRWPASPKLSWSSARGNVGFAHRFRAVGDGHDVARLCGGAYPSRRRRRSRAWPRLLSLGFIALFASDLVLAHAPNVTVLLAGAALWGSHMGLTQGLLAALVAAASPRICAGPPMASSTWFAAWHCSLRACLQDGCGMVRTALDVLFRGGLTLIAWMASSATDGARLSAAGRTLSSATRDQRESSDRSSSRAGTRIAVATEFPRVRDDLYYRHALPVRIMHWINVVAHDDPADERAEDLQWASGAVLGQVVVDGGGADPRDRRGKGVGGEPQGVTRVFGHPFDTTGVLGLSKDRDGGSDAGGAFRGGRRFPTTMAVDGAVVALFLRLGVAGERDRVPLVFEAARHLARDLGPTARLRSIGQSSADHLRFRHRRGSGEALQRAAEDRLPGVIFVLALPLVLMGLAMSPWPTPFCRVGRCRRRRQAARTLHFVLACLLVTFVLVHVFR